MSATCFEDLERHAGHRLECVFYGGYGKDAANVAIECLTCNEVLLDFDKKSGEFCAECHQIHPMGEDCEKR